MKRTHRRLTFVIIGAGLLAIAAALVLSALDDSIVFFQTPSELVATAPDADRRLRVGGLVEDGSVEKSIGGQVRFRITDTAARAWSRKAACATAFSSRTVFSPSTMRTTCRRKRRRRSNAPANGST